MRIAVCDDDDLEIASLSKLIDEYQAARGVQIDRRLFHSGTELLYGMRGGEYDIVFLDVLMPGLSGIQAAQELRELDKNVRLIFLSASPDFALDSYIVDAYHYLLKPAEADTLFPLLDKIEKDLSLREKQGFILKNRKGIIWISFTELIYADVINKTVSFHLSDGSIHKAAATLSEYEKILLSRPEFLKTHRSYIVNLSHVQAVCANCVVTKNGYTIPLSRLLRRRIRDAFTEFLSPAVTGSPESEAPTAVSEEPAPGLWRILLVDDDPAERTLWSDVLRCHGCMVEHAENGRDALKLAADKPFDCVLLDVMLPGENGYSICKELCSVNPAPVIFLSCLTESHNQIEGFAAGGIDYIPKNTPVDLFWTKVETRIRLAVSDRTQLCFGTLILDLTEHRAFIGDKELPLTPVEFDILRCLSEYAGQVISPRSLFDMVWGGQPWDGGETVQLHMSRLRRKLEKSWEKHLFIDTVWGEGYRFIPEED